MYCGCKPEGIYHDNSYDVKGYRQFHRLCPCVSPPPINITAPFFDLGTGSSFLKIGRCNRFADGCPNPKAFLSVPKNKWETPVKYYRIPVILCNSCCRVMEAVKSASGATLALAEYAANPLFDSKCYRFESQTSCPQISMAIAGKRCYSGNIEA